MITQWKQIPSSCVILGIALVLMLNGIANWSYGQAIVDPLAERDKQWQKVVEVGNQAFQKGDFQQAIEAYQKAMTLRPNEVGPQFKIAEIFSQQGEYEKARDAFIAVLELEPQNTSALNHLGYIYGEKLKNYKAAASQYEKALEISPDLLESLVPLGSVYRELGQLEKAEAALSRALELDPNATRPESRNLHNDLGLVYLQKGETEKAVAEFHKSLQRFPEDKWAEGQLKSIQDNTPSSDISAPAIITPRLDDQILLRAQKRVYFDQTLRAFTIEDDTQRKLKAIGIETLSDLRKKGDLKKVEALSGVSDSEIKKLRRASMLSLISKDIELNVVLEKELAKASSFKITEQSLKNLESEGVSDDVLERLQGLKNREVKKEEEFLNFLKSTIGDEQTVKYQSLILKHSKREIDSIKGVAQLSADELVNMSGGQLNFDSAEKYIRKTHDLYGLVNMEGWYVRNRQGTPPPLLELEIAPAELAWFPTFSLAEPSLCNESDDLFSPAVYLLYLIDFVSKYLGVGLDALDHRFFQKFEDLPIYRDTGRTGGYVQFSNEILVNLIATLRGEPWDKIFDVSERARIKTEIYRQFNKPSPYESMPGFDPNVLIDLFDSYLREFNITRREVQLLLDATPISLDPTTGDYDPRSKYILGNFAGKHGLAIGDLGTIDSANPQTVSNDDVELLKARLFKFHYWHELHDTVKQEFIAKIVKEKRQEFRQKLGKLRDEEVDRILPNLLPASGLPLGNEEYERETLKAIAQAQTSVELNQTMALFRIFAHDYPEYTSGISEDKFAQDKFARLKSLTAGNKYDELLAQRGYTESLFFVINQTDADRYAIARYLDTAKLPPNPASPLQGLPIDPGTTTIWVLEQGNRWIVSDTTKEKTFSVKKVGNDLNIYEGQHQLFLEAVGFATDRLGSDEEFEKQLSELATRAFYEGQAFRDEVRRRATEREKTSVSRAELGFHSKIRTNLIVIALRMMAENPANSPIPLYKATVDSLLTVVTPADIQLLGDFLHLDLTVDETYTTTPLSLAINRLQSFVQAAQLGTEKYIITSPMSEREKHTWEWLKSYSTWHAAMMVMAYPENFLIPDVRQPRTPQFDAVSQRLDEKGTEQAVSQYASQTNRLSNMAPVGSVVASDRIFFFGSVRPGETYYSIKPTTGAWIPWTRVPDAMDNLPGHLHDSIQMRYEDGYIYLFAVTSDVSLKDAPEISGETDKPRRKRVNFSLYLMRLRVDGNQLLSDGSMEGESSGGTLGSWTRLDLKINDVDYYVQSVTVALHGTTDNFTVILAMSGTQVFYRRCYVADMSKPFEYTTTFAQPDTDMLLDPFEIVIAESHEYMGYSSVVPDQESVELDKGNVPNRIMDAFNGRDMPISNERHISGSTPNWIIDDGGRRAYLEMKTEFTPSYRNFYDVRVYDVSYNAILSVTSVQNSSNYALWCQSELTSARDIIRMKLYLASTHYENLHSGVLIAEPLWSDEESFTYAAYQSSPDEILVAYPSIEGGHHMELVRVSLDYTTQGWTRQATHTWASNLSDISQNETDFVCRSVSKVGENSYVFFQGYDISQGYHNRTTRLYYYKMNSQSTKVSRITPPSLESQQIRPRWSQSRLANDDSRIYLEEYYLHLPVMIAAYLNDSGRYEDAMKELQYVYDPLLDESYRVTAPVRVLLENAPVVCPEGPFDPYGLAGYRVYSYSTSPDVKFAYVYLLNVKFAHVKNLLDWADHLFVQDTSESVNRARELYELASDILGLKEWGYNYSIDSQTPEDAQEKKLGDLILIDLNAESTQPAAEADLLGNIPEECLEALGSVTIAAEIPELKPFCLPMNPLVKLLRWRIESNLAKIRTNRNLAGIPREMQPYAIPLDPVKLLKQGVTEGIDFVPLIPATPPPIYRYSFLLDSAKHLVSIAQQLEGFMLSSLEEAANKSYNLLRAKQDLGLERANATLQGLRVAEAVDSVSLSEMQQARAQFMRDHYQQLLQKGLNPNEEAALGFYEASYLAPDSISVGTGGISFSVSPSGKLQTLASIASTKASYERRKEEWQYQQELAEQDITIADIGTDVADDRVAIVEQERDIANLRVGYANDSIEFLAKQPTNVELYRWMSKNLRELYQEQLKMGISIAKSAQRALEFERQTSLGFIGYDYWDYEKQGLLGAERLLQDLDKMEQYRLSTASRKKEITKTISLASVAPVEFQRFRETGLLEFETASRWFDQDFPGHYMRLIRNVSVSVLALIPPNQGIHATLSNPGISRVMVGPPFEEPSIIYRLPESIALSSPNNETGLFELSPSDPMLFPFEGIGVATTWRLEMPKGANRFDYNTLFDIFFTVRYTALEDSSYRTKVLAEMGQDESGYVDTQAVRYFSLRNEFADQWYYFHHPIVGLTSSEYFDPFIPETESNNVNKPLKPYTMVIELKESDFVPNEEFRKIKKITLAVQKSNKIENQNATLPIRLGFIPDNGRLKERQVNLSVPQTSDSTDAMNGLRPYGKWILEVETNTPQTIDISWFEDMLLVVEYEAKVHYNR